MGVHISLFERYREELARHVREDPASCVSSHFYLSPGSIFVDGAVHACSLQAVHHSSTGEAQGSTTCEEGLARRRQHPWILLRLSGFVNSGRYLRDVDKLGLGEKRLGLGAFPSVTSLLGARFWRSCPATSGNIESRRRAHDGPRSLWGPTSDTFFERGAYDPAPVSEGRARLARFQGAMSISASNQRGAQASVGSSLDDGSLTGLENAARDVVSCIMANPDVQNLGDSIRSGALTLSSTDVRALVSDGKRWDLFM
ncbi:hypothetical protein BJV77DRAFT_962115 [Russula vinacea]|nr:hypothetical protein BJV77DRAFT_962115 [Russula vinacea]